ncbi:MAG TPA: flagellar assembly protein FliW [Phycisphaerae bacterium]|nr:flagellar assembly protein FliW [Phycisphaerae bacterium]
MRIETTRFGPIDINPDRVITFADGLLGFPGMRRFALIETTTDAVFFWLQSVDEPGLAFVVCDPQAFVPDYRAQVRADDLRLLEMRDLADCQVFVIVNKVDGWLTANLLGPRVIGAGSRLGRQLVLSDRRYTIQHRLRDVRGTPAAAKTA